MIYHKNEIHGYGFSVSGTTFNKPFIFQFRKENEFLFITQSYENLQYFKERFSHFFIGRRDFRLKLTVRNGYEFKFKIKYVTVDVNSSPLDCILIGELKNEKDV